MIKKTLFVYNSLNLFNIINEIKENFYFELEYIDKKNHKKIDFEQYENYLIISTDFDEKIKTAVIWHKSTSKFKPEFGMPIFEEYSSPSKSDPPGISYSNNLV